MGMTDKSLCNSCTNIGCEFQSGIVRTKCAFYMPPQLESDNCGNYVVQDSTTKNDLGDDCVRRKAVLNTLERMDKVLDEDRTVDSYKELLKECYKVLPSVAPQESVLEKLKAEIEQLRLHKAQFLTNDNKVCIDSQEVLNILDRYMTESEDKDGNNN